ncbi:MAG: amidase [Hyphomicrobiaceae bacterium]
MLWELSAKDAVEQIRSGLISSEDLTSACLDRIAETEEAIGAWSVLDREAALNQAMASDDVRRRGRPAGSLHGVPIAISGSFDLDSVPAATVINKLKEAGAVIIGSTTGATRRDAAGCDGTRNPHNAAHVAGMATAAAVAAGHVPCSVDLQSDDSIVQSASFCGIYGFKPTSGVISRKGSSYRSQTLDQIGLFGRTLSDVALLCDALSGFDPSDQQSYTNPKPRMLEGAQAEAPVDPCFASFEQHVGESLSEVMQYGMAELIEALDRQVEMLPTPRSFAEVIAASSTVHAYERDATKDSDGYHHAVAMAAGAREHFDTFFADFDAIISPPACGEAPTRGEKPTDPGWATIWSFAGLPCLSLPLLRGAAGLPAGIQLSNSREEDDRLLRTASWLERRLAVDEGTDFG